MSKQSEVTDRLFKDLDDLVMKIAASSATNPYYMNCETLASIKLRFIDIMLARLGTNWTTVQKLGEEAVVVHPSCGIELERICFGEKVEEQQMWLFQHFVRKCKLFTIMNQVLQGGDKQKIRYIKRLLAMDRQINIEERIEERLNYYVERLKYPIEQEYHKEAPYFLVQPSDFMDEVLHVQAVRRMYDYLDGVYDEPEETLVWRALMRVYNPTIKELDNSTVIDLQQIYESYVTDKNVRQRLSRNYTNLNK